MYSENTLCSLDTIVIREHSSNIQQKHFSTEYTHKICRIYISHCTELKYQIKNDKLNKCTIQICDSKTLHYTI